MGKFRALAVKLVEQSAWTEVATGALIVLNAVTLACEEQYRGLALGSSLGHYNPTAFKEMDSVDMGFWVAECMFAAIWTIEVLLRIAVLKWRYFLDVFNVADFIIVVLSDIACMLALNANIQLFRIIRVVRLLRLLRLMRRIRGFDSLYLMTTAIQGCVGVLGWAIVVLFVVQVMLALFLTNILRDSYLETIGFPLEERLEVYEYFGTFTRSFLSLIEMTLANWPPICRLLVENVSEVMWVFCVCHKLVMGFAVVGVINGVFMQEAFKVASTDDHIMVRTKQRAMELHIKQMEKFFHHADVDKSGVITWKEFSEVLSDENLKTWLASMDLDVQDLELLFDHIGGAGSRRADGKPGAKRGRQPTTSEIQDDKPGISKDQLIHGISNLTGPAKNMHVKILMSSVKELEAAVQRNKEDIERNHELAIDNRRSLRHELAEDDSSKDRNDSSKDRNSGCGEVGDEDPGFQPLSGATCSGAAEHSGGRGGQNDWDRPPLADQATGERSPRTESATTTRSGTTKNKMPKSSCLA